MKQSDKNFLLIDRCQNDEQRIKLLEFFRFLETNNIAYSRLELTAKDLHLKDALPEETVVSFDLCIPSRKLVFNLFAGLNFSSCANHTEALIEQSVDRALADRPSAEAKEALSVAVRRHIINSSYNFPSSLKPEVESPWYVGKDIQVWLLRGANFDSIRTALLS